MLLTDEIFEAYLKCETKSYLKSTSIIEGQSEFAEWRDELSSTFKQKGIAQLQRGFGRGEYFTGTPPLEVIKAGGYLLIIDCSLKAQNLKSNIHALERIALKRKTGKYAYIPMRFIPNERITKHDKLLLAFDALVLSRVIGKTPLFGRLIHGREYRSTRVHFTNLVDSVKEEIGKISLVQAANHPPQLVLNKHCVECEFRPKCRETAIEKDELTLLSGLTKKERSTFHNKGIFSIFQLSHTFRPRRKPKRLGSRPDKYSHALKALAIRENKVHVVGKPDLQITGSPIYLDVEGNPDSGFYYLIGV